MKMSLAISLLATLLAATPVHAEKFYKWQDADGVWHYSNKPPKDQPAEALTVRAKGATQSDEERAEQARKAKARSGVPVATAEQCEKLRANLKLLDTEVGVRVDRNADGVPEEISMEEQRAEAEKARNQIERFCD